MTLGRPLMISGTLSRSVPYPNSIDDEYLLVEPNEIGSQPSHKPSKVEFFVSSLGLYSILEEILSTFYPSCVNGGTTSGNDFYQTKFAKRLDFNSILSLDQSLTKWRESLPSCLMMCEAPIDTRSDPVFPRQANILELR